MRKKTNPILADMHCHLHEKRLKPTDWWAGVQKKKLAVIAITEHPQYDPRDAYLQLKAIQPKNVLLIPGMETKTNIGDLLVFGTDESVYDHPALLELEVPVEKALKVIKEHKLTAVFPHPYGYKRDSICEMVSEKQAYALMRKYNVGAEYYNGLLGSANELIFGRAFIKRFYNMLAFVEKNRATHALRINLTTNPTKKKIEFLAHETLEKVRKGMLFAQKAPFITAGSDGHYPKALGCGVVELTRQPKDETDFLRMIREGNIIRAGPNLYTKHPVDIVTRKEMLEGLTYMTKKRVIKTSKSALLTPISKKIRLSKRIKTIKRITKRSKLGKIKAKLPKIRIKKRLTRFKKKIGLGK